jgi:hypothetical protein
LLSRARARIIETARKDHRIAPIKGAFLAFKEGKMEAEEDRRKIHCYMMGPKGHPIGLWLRDEKESKEIVERWKKEYPAFRRFMKFNERYHQDSLFRDTRYFHKKWLKYHLKMELWGVKKKEERRKIIERWKERTKKCLEGRWHNKSLWEYFKDRLEQWRDDLYWKRRDRIEKRNRKRGKGIVILLREGTEETIWNSTAKEAKQLMEAWAKYSPEYAKTLDAWNKERETKKKKKH